MTGYHYTTLKNWRKIQKEGLKPQVLENLSLQLTVDQHWGRGTKLFGIWLWREEQEPLSHLGNIMRVVAIHNSPKVVVLRAHFNADDLIKTPYGGNLEVTHDGQIEKFVYHTGIKSWVVGNAIGAGNIELVQEFDMVQLTLPIWRNGIRSRLKSERLNRIRGSSPFIGTTL